MTHGNDEPTANQHSTIWKIITFPATRRGRWLVILFWVVLMAGISPLASKVNDLQDNDTASWLPESAESLKVSQLQDQFDTSDTMTAFMLVMAALIAVSGYTSINAVVKAELFPAHIRALGVALPYAIANALFGGSAEYVALQLKDWGVESAFYWYVSGMIGLSLIVYVFMSDTRRTSLIDRD